MRRVPPRDRRIAPRRSLPRVEALEGRHLLAAFAVTNPLDSGPGSLRQAILDANDAIGASTVAFEIPGGGVHTIALDSFLPIIDGTLAIDATTQPGYAGTPLVAIDGANAGSNSNGLTFEKQALSVESSVKGLAIERFSGVGIAVFGDQMTIQGDYIGVDPSGKVAAGNRSGGILLSDNGTNGGASTIGGTTGAGNVISGNGLYGVELSETANTLISHNFIGTDASGQLDLGNAREGVDIGFGASATTISSNTIANNRALGIRDHGMGTVLDSNVLLNNGPDAVADLVVVASKAAVATATGRVEAITYTVTNRGPHVATNVALNVVTESSHRFLDNPSPPPILELAGAIVSQGPTSPGVSISDPSTGVVPIGTLAPGGSASVTLAVSVVGSGSDSLEVMPFRDQLTTGQNTFASTAFTVASTADVDLAVMALPTPGVAKVGVPLEFRFLVTDRDPRFSTSPQVALDLTGLSDASIVSVSTSQGNLMPLPGRADFYAGTLTRPNPSFAIAAPIGLAPGESALITVVVVPTRPGKIRVVVASSSPGDNDPDPTNNIAIAGALAGFSPTVTRASLLPASGQIRTVLLVFDAPLKRAEAQNLRNYRLTTTDRNSRIGIRSATYNGKNHVVTLRLCRSLPRGGARIRLVVGGRGSPGLTAPDRSTLLGGTFTTTINRG